jgi:hypothetical protein
LMQRMRFRCWQQQHEASEITNLKGVDRGWVRVKTCPDLLANSLYTSGKKRKSSATTPGRKKDDVLTSSQ